jgi:hypothetical protein
VARREHSEAEHLAQAVELLAPGLRPGGVGQQSLGANTELLGHEVQRRFGDGIARRQQPAGMAKGTELEGVAELVRIAPAAADCHEIGSVQRPVPNKVLFRPWARRTALRAALW